MQYHPLPGKIECINCKSDKIVNHKGEYICTDCAVVQTQIRNEASDDEVFDTGPRTMHMPMANGSGTRQAMESLSGQVVLLSKVQGKLILMAEAAAPLAKVSHKAVMDALEALWMDYMERYLEVYEHRYRVLGKPRRRESKEPDGMLRRKKRLDLAGMAPAPSQAVLLAVLWQSLLIAHAPVMPPDLVGWFNGGGLSASPREVHEALRELLRQKSARRKKQRRTSRWRMLAMKTVTSTDVFRAVEDLAEFGLRITRPKAPALLPRLLEAAGPAVGGVDRHLEEAAAWYLLLGLRKRPAGERPGTSTVTDARHLHGCGGGVLAAAAVLQAARDLGRTRRQKRAESAREALVPARRLPSGQEREDLWKAFDEDAAEGGLDETADFPPSMFEQALAMARRLGGAAAPAADPGAGTQGALEAEETLQSRLLAMLCGDATRWVRDPLRAGLNACTKDLKRTAQELEDFHDTPRRLRLRRRSSLPFDAAR